MIPSPTELNADAYVSKLRATSVIENPYPDYAALRAAGPVSYAPAHDIWVVSRYAACAAVLRNATAYRELDNPWVDRWHAADDATARSVDPAACPVAGHGGRSGDKSSSRLTPREAMVNRAAVLAQHAVVKEQRIGALADGLIGAFRSAGKAEIVGQLVRPLVTSVIGELFGVPPDVWTSYFDGWYERFRPTIDPAERARRDFLNPWNSFLARQAAFFVATGAELAERRRKPRDDVLGATARLENVHDPEGDREIPRMVARFATSAVVSMTDFLGNTLWLILRDPEVHQRLRADLTLIPRAIDEALRLEPPITALFFQARDTTELDGTRIPAGARLIVLLASANRDADIFPDPDCFDLHRPNTATHLAFSLGAGSCCGVPLVRRLGKMTLDRLLTRFPDLRLQSDQELTHFAKRYNRGFQHLWLEFDPR